jgi:hypothetical protein
MQRLRPREEVTERLSQSVVLRCAHCDWMTEGRLNSAQEAFGRHRREAHGHADTPSERTCSKCNTLLPLTCFPRANYAAREWWCRQCKNESQRERTMRLRARRR